MKKIIEIFDISDDYQDYIGNPYVVVINQSCGVDNNNFKNILDSHYTVLSVSEWIKYKSIISDFNNNDAKHRMRKEQPLEYAESNKWKRIYDTEIALSDNSHVAKAIICFHHNLKADLLNTILMERHIKKLLWKKVGTFQQYMNLSKGLRKNF